jgi:hypothetical protein
VDVGHDQGGTVRFRIRDSRRAFRRYPDTISGGDQPFGQELAQDGIVLDHEDAFGLLHARMM